MSDLKGVFKGGWHPKGKDGGRESWRGDYKGINQVAGWVGKSKKPGAADAQENTHISRPLTTLKDPALFGPPPKNVNYHGGAALPNEITPHTGGWGAPLNQDQLNYSNGVTEEEQEESKPAPPPLPFRSDRTGLKTDNLPAPPVRRDFGGAEDGVEQRPRPVPRLPPRLPSRQNTESSMEPSHAPPAYEETASTTRSPVSSLNQSAVNRLGSAGISVPGLGIGGKNKSSSVENPWSSVKSQNQNKNQNQSQDQNQNQPMSELASRFQRLNSRTTQNSNGDSTSATSPSAQSPSMPTWNQTQSSLKTAQNFQKDPSSVSLADAQQAAATAQQAHTNAQAFRARHADKIDAAERKATAFNKRYNMTGRLNKFLEDANNEHDQVQQQHLQQQQTNTPGQQPPPALPIHPNANTTTTSTSISPQTQQIQQNQASYQRASPPLPISSPPQKQNQIHQTPDTTTAVEGLTKSIGRKPPPPPPPKKPTKLQSPPPVPLGTRPNF